MKILRYTGISPWQSLKWVSSAYVTVWTKNKNINETVMRRQLPMCNNTCSWEGLISDKQHSLGIASKNVAKQVKDIWSKNTENVTWYKNLRLILFRSPCLDTSWLLGRGIIYRVISALKPISNENQKWDPLRAMKTFIRRKVGHTT